MASDGGFGAARATTIKFIVFKMVPPYLSRVANGLLVLALRHVHDHPREQVKTRLDRIDVDVFGIVRMPAETAQPEALENGRLGFQGCERRVGAAAFGNIADDEVLTDFR